MAANLDEALQEQFAAEYKPDPELDNALWLAKVDAEEFLKLPVAKRLAAGHYKERRDAWRAAQERQKASATSK